MSLQFSCGLGKKWLNAYVRHRSVAPNGSNHPPGRKTLRNDRPEHSIRCDQAEMFKNPRSEEHTSELQSLMRISYAVFCLKKKKSLETLHTHSGHHNHSLNEQ